MVNDQDIRRAISEIAARADELPVAPDLSPRLAQVRRRHLILRAVAVPVTLLLIAAIGYWAVDALRGDQMVVIDDAPPAEVGGTGATDQVDTPSNEDTILETVREIIAFVEAGEIVIQMPPTERDAIDLTGGPLEVLRAYEDMLAGNNLSIFLTADAEEEDLQRVRTDIGSWPEVETYDLVSSEEALERLRQDLGEDAEEVLGDLSGNPLPASFEIRLQQGASGKDLAERLSDDPAVDEVIHGSPLSPDRMAAAMSIMLTNATATNPEAEEWLVATRHRLPTMEGDPFGLGPGNTGDRPGYLTAWPDLSLKELRRRVVDRVEAPTDPETNRSYVYLPYHLPEGFLPAGAWGGEKLGSHHNPAVDGSFYAAAFSDDETAIRLVVNPELATPSYTLGALAWPEVRDNDALWKPTNASVMRREAYELVRDGIDYFRFEMPKSTLYVYGPEEIRPEIWELAEALVPVAVEPPSGMSAGMPEDFDFVFEFGVTMRNRLDTAGGTFAKDMVTEPPVTTDLTLSESDMEEIYDRLRDIRFWEYPADFDPSGDGGVEPFVSYRMRVVAAGESHTVRWDDLSFSGALDAVALRALFERIQEIIMSKPAYQALPEARGGYL